MLGNPVLIQLYLDKSEKKAFKKACFQSDTTMSREIRRFVREYSKDYIRQVSNREQEDLFDD
jgi:hypothetical protein